MSKWVKDAIGIAVAVILIAIAWRFLQGDGGEVTVMESGVKIQPKISTGYIDSHADKPFDTDVSKKKICRSPSNEIEFWEKTEKWTADSGWRKGGSSAGEFCGAQKLERESKYPDRKVVLLDTSDKHKTEYDPFKRDYYRYSCFFEDRWEPVYKLAESLDCP